jgi:hypothetical protein
VNKYKDKGLPAPAEVEDFARFKNILALDRLDTAEPMAVKYRFLRQFTHALAPYDKNKYGEYPQIVLDKINSDDNRFEVVYHNGKPFLRTDKNDLEFAHYKPTNEDLNWDVDAYFKRMKTLYG